MGIYNLRVVFLFIFLTNLNLSSAKLSRVFEENPFLNGEFQPGINVPQGPVNDPVDNTPGTSPPIIDPIHVNYKPNLILPTVNPTIKPGPIGPILPPIIHGDLHKYCLQPRGQFQGPYCNSFVNCWDGNVVEQFCGASLVYNPKGYCDYVWNVNCHGKPIKEILPITSGSNGWPSDGSYVPPVSPTPPPVTYPPGPKPTVRPTQPRPPYVPGGTVTIEPPGFGLQDPTQPPHDHTHHTTTTTTWRPTIAIQPPAYNELRKYCLHPRGQFAGPHCHKFVNCWDDVVIEQDCPDGLNFNPNKHYCDFPYNYPCRIHKDSGNFEFTNTEVSEDNQLGS